jgi:hypothetical protein
MSGGIAFRPVGRPLCGEDQTCEALRDESQFDPESTLTVFSDCKHQRHNPWRASPLLHHAALIPESLMIDHHFSAPAFTIAPSGDPKSEPPDVWRCYGASVASVAPVLAAAAEMFLGAWQHGIVGEYPVSLYL